MGKKFHWVDNSIKIDFDVPEVLLDCMQNAEQYDIANMYGAYYNWADTIDLTARDLCSAGLITKEQWGIILRRYPL